MLGIELETLFLTEEVGFVLKEWSTLMPVEPIPRQAQAYNGVLFVLQLMKRLNRTLQFCEVS